MNVEQQFNILDLIEAHRSKTGLTKTAFGRLSVGDPSLVFELEGGRELRRRTVARIMSFIVTGQSNNRVGSK